MIDSVVLAALLTYCVFSICLTDVCYTADRSIKVIIRK